MNHISVTGRLTDAPVLRELEDGGAVCRLRLAVDGMAPGRETGYINVTEFGKPGEASARVLSKGWLVAVHGRLEYQRWQSDAGENRHDYGIVGRVEHLAAPRNDTRERQATQARETTQEAAAGDQAADPGAPGAATRVGRPPTATRAAPAREAVGTER
jgi:single stranded DNA-binding protein